MTKSGVPENIEFDLKPDAAVINCPSFLGALYGLFFYPSDTLEALVGSKSQFQARQDRWPPYVWSFLAMLLAAIFSPILWQIYRWDFLETRVDSIVALFGVLSISAVIFVVLEHSLLRWCGEPLKHKMILTLLSYGCVPLIPIVIVFYVVDYAMFGRLTIVTFVITGTQNPNDPTMMAFPLVQLIGKVFFLFIFYRGLRILRGISTEAGIIISLISALPYYFGVILSLEISDLLAPGSVKGIQLLATSVFRMLGN